MKITILIIYIPITLLFTLRIERKRLHTVRGGGEEGASGGSDFGQCLNSLDNQKAA